jgi:NTE family protein
MKKTRRVARVAAQQRMPLGIVLSGGGVRGVAHIGVLRALMERGIHPDFVAGVSAGAIVGALYAAGHSPRDMLRFFQEIHPLSLELFSFAKPGFMDTDKLVPLFARFFPEDTFNALKKRLRVLATDMLNGRPVVFEEGELILPLLASASVPMVYSPTEINGRWFSDGGIADNFPVGLLEDRCDRILGVYVNPLQIVQITDLGTSLDVLGRAMDVGMFLQSQAKFPLCDLVIQPQGLDAFGMFESKRVKDIEQIGYEAAMARMAEIERVVGAPAAQAPAAPR